jgi:GTP-binding protein HflX
VCETLAEIDRADKPTIVVFNKIDAYEFEEREEDQILLEGENLTLDELRKSWMAKLNDTKCIFISAQKKENIDEFKSIVYDEVKRIFQIRYPYHNFLYEK